MSISLLRVSNTDTLYKATETQAESNASGGQPDVDFRVTKAMLDTGLRGYPVGTCTTSFLTAEKGLHYRGYPVASVVDRSPEELMYLLYEGRMGTEEQVAIFGDALVKRSGLSDDIKERIAALPKTIHPMDAFAEALRFCRWEYVTGDYREDALNLLAKAPELAAAVIRAHSGKEGVGDYNAEQGYVENFVRLLYGDDEVSSALLGVMEIFHKLHYDHGGGNLSMFVAKAVASGYSDMYGSAIAGVEALAGPLHGRANQDGLQLIQEMLEAVGADATPAEVRAEVQRRLDNREKIPGFGHAVLRSEDPRATVLYTYAKEHFPDEPMVKMALLLRTEAPEVLKSKATNPYPNVDAISGALLSAAGFDRPEYFTVLFALSRLVGMTRQIVYERCEARGGRGVPIYRPRYVYEP